MKRFSLALLLLAVAILPFFLVSTTAANDFTDLEFFAYDRTESDRCGGCHRNPGMPFVTQTWLNSGHANSFKGGNTYCAKCHSPLQGDPEATRGDNDPVAFEDWQAVTCGVCHPPHDLRDGDPENGEVGVIGIYLIGGDPAEVDSWKPVESANELCENCHSREGRHNRIEFQGFGTAMDQNGVECVDCHMAKVENYVAEDETERHAHDMSPTANFPDSCFDGCHDNKTAEWALKQIEKQKIHRKEK